MRYHPQTPIFFERNPGLITEKIKMRLHWYYWVLEMSLIKEYVITEISAASDGSPFILITLKNPSDLRGPQRKMNNPSMVAFTSVNDIMKNLGNVMSKQMMGSSATIIKITLDEYEKSEFKVGDRISVKLDKTIGLP